MMIPQIAEKLLSKYGQESQTLFDPYCGTGTSLVEANIKDINAIGTDLNPLARLIAKAKTTELDLQMLDLYLKDFNDFAFQFRFEVKNNNHSIIQPQFKNIDFWFNQTAQEKLSIIKSFIDNIKQESIKQFFLTAFSETIRESSLTKKGEFKLVRMPEDKREKFNPDSFGIFLSKLSRNKRGLVEFSKTKLKGAASTVKGFNTVNDIPNEEIEDNSIDIVVTSPPYGDSKTTVAYGQYSRLSSQWMGIENANQVDNNLMGGKKLTNEKIDCSEKLKTTMKKEQMKCFRFLWITKNQSTMFPKN